MTGSIIIAPIIFAVISPAYSSQYLYETKKFTQRVDNFGFANEDSWEQRYLINDSFYRVDENGRPGPIFFYTGNEGDITVFADNSGFIWDIAPEFGALVVFAEHRYYGKSIPYGNEATKPNPKLNGFLTSGQALADFARLISFIKTNPEDQRFNSSAVIAFGGSYGGMLAAWLRMKYPHVCDGAIASSAPINMFDVNCNSFALKVTKDYDGHDKNCSSWIRKSWPVYEKKLATDAGKKELSEYFSLCKEEDIGEFRNYMELAWISIAEMDYPYETSFLAPLPANPVKVVCERILDDENEEEDEELELLRRMRNGIAVYFNHSGESQCMDVAKKDDLGTELWYLQACTEMVSPFCFDGDKDMFYPSPWDFAAYSKQCHEKWKVTPDPDMANIEYGGDKIKAASNIIFSNGDLDPWSVTGGILENVNPSVIAITMKGAAHHMDLRSANENDPQEVVLARILEKIHIRKWIEEAFKNGNSFASVVYSSPYFILTVALAIILN